jgi:hypothetical protein
VSDAANAGQPGQAPTFRFYPCGEFFHVEDHVSLTNAVAQQKSLVWLHGRMLHRSRSCQHG